MEKALATFVIVVVLALAALAALGAFSALIIGSNWLHAKSYSVWVNTITPEARLVYLAERYGRKADHFLLEPTGESK